MDDRTARGKEQNAAGHSHRARLTVIALVVAAVIAGIFYAKPPRKLTIETGPVNGSYYHDALLYQKILSQKGIDLQLRANPKTLEIMSNLANPDSGIDVGFIAGDLSSKSHNALYSLGQIELQPLFIFATSTVGRRSELDDLRGRRIVMPPEDSVTSDAAMHVFQLYDITKDNSKFVFMPLGDAVKALRAGQFDAGVFMLAPENPYIQELTNDSGLHLVPIKEVKAISNHLPFLQPVTLPRGIYSIADGIPPYNTPMVAAPISLLVRHQLHPYLLYSLLQAMTDVHRQPTFVSESGQFPTLTGSQFGPDPLAAQFYRSGVPWPYNELSPWLASIVDTYHLLLLGLLLLSVLYISTRCVAAICRYLAGSFGGLRSPAPMPQPEPQRPPLVASQ